MDTLYVAVLLAFVLIVLEPSRLQCWFVWFIGLIFVVFITHILKYIVATLTHRAPWTLRPSDAPCNCDFTPIPSSKKRPGFPSGHAAFAAYYVIGLTWLFQSPIPVLLGLPWMLYVGHQRIQSRCHTPLQVVTGYLLGIICALSLYLYRC